MKNYQDALEAIVDNNEELHRAYSNWSRCEGAVDLKDHFYRPDRDLIMLCEVIELCHYLIKAQEKAA